MRSYRTQTELRFRFRHVGTRLNAITRSVIALSHRKDGKSSLFTNTLREYMKLGKNNLYTDLDLQMLLIWTQKKTMLRFLKRASKCSIAMGKLQILGIHGFSKFLAQL